MWLCRHVYFAGNMPEYESAVVKGEGGQRVRLVCVPRFASTGTVVLVDLDDPDFATTPMTFGGARATVPMETEEEEPAGSAADAMEG